MIARLSDPWFEAEFYGNATEKSYQRQGASIDGAQGLFLWCPCAYPNDKRAHGLIIPFTNPRNAPELPPEHGPKVPDSDFHPRWVMSGTGLDDLTLMPSVNVGPPCSCWHGFINNGEVS